jgi:hypothetical protein
MIKEPDRELHCDLNFKNAWGFGWSSTSFTALFVQTVPDIRLSHEQSLT